MRKQSLWNRFLNWYSPVWGMLVPLVIAVGFLFVLEYKADEQKLAFSNACATMGGVALIGRNGTKVCFKQDVVLSVH